MSVFKRVLVAVDGSETSDMGLQKAIEIAGDQQAALRIIHVIDTAPVVLGYADFGGVGELISAIRAAGEKVVERARAVAADAGIPCDAKVVEVDRVGERIAGMIEKEALEWPADLVVAGTHGRRGFNHLLLGSVAEALVRLSTQPVLLIRGQASG